MKRHKPLLTEVQMKPPAKTQPEVDTHCYELAEFFIQLEPLQDAKQREQYTWSLASAIQQAVEDWFNTP